MLNFYLFLSISFLLIFLIGKLFEKIKVPWIFSALIIGFFLAIKNPFEAITSSNTFNFLAQLGMYFLLFVIGLEVDVKEFKKLGKFIIKGTIFITLFSTLFLIVLIYYFFHLSLFVSFVIALSFSTVGEAILIPILDEFKIVNTKLGQSIIGIGVLDDLFEIFTLILIIPLIASPLKNSTGNILTILISLTFLSLLAYGLRKFRKEEQRFNFKSIETLFLFTLFIFFLFLGVGEYADALAIGALLAGLSIKTFVPPERLQAIESEIKTLCYGFFAPIFFLQIGISMDINTLLSSPLLILLIVIVSSLAKLIGSWLIGIKEMGVKQATLMGIGLSVRFSTSLIIIRILYKNAVINVGLYSIIIASSIIFTFLIPIIFSILAVKWKQDIIKEKKVAVV